MLTGSSPQSWVTSYLWSPSPRTGLALPDLSSAPRMSGAEPSRPRVARRVRCCMWRLYSLWSLTGPNQIEPYIEKLEAATFVIPVGDAAGERGCRGNVAAELSGASETLFNQALLQAAAT